jgi:SOS regulatory protein LexA
MRGLTGERSFLYNDYMDDRYKKKIQTFFQNNRRMPSYSEIMKLTGFKSKDSVFKLIQRLETSGFIRKDPTGKIVPNKNFGEIKILGLVEAGFPSAAEEELADTVSLDDYLIDNKEATYMLRVKGDSMKGAGIIEGDVVLVERAGEAKVGQIVIAEVDGEWTMKYLRKNEKGYYLEAANKRYKAIFPTERLKISAVVKAVIRKY